MELSRDTFTYNQLPLTFPHTFQQAVQSVWSSEADTSIKLYENIDWYLLWAKMPVWQEASAAFGPWLSIKSKQNG